jgi:hypothetical protein
LCSMCKKIRVDEKTWVEVEEGIAQLGLFHTPAMPALSHGVCDACYNRFVQELEDDDTDAS